MKLSQLDRFHLEPVGKFCCHCAFCDKHFRADDYYCCLRDAISKILNESPNSWISCIFNTTCDMFTSKEEFARMVEVEEHEKFKILNTLGKFNGIPDEILKMRDNFFVDKHDATSKQINYMQYLAINNRTIPPLKIGVVACDITPINDKEVLRSWISDEVSKQVKSSMM